MKKPSKKTLAMVLANRAQFSKSGAFLRKSRKEMVELCYDSLTDLSVPAKTRNEQLLEVVEMAVKYGIYAQPDNFGIEKHGSHSDIRWSIGRMLWREWIKRKNEQLKKEGFKHLLPSCDWREWSPWCSRNGWDIKSRFFINKS